MSAFSMPSFYRPPLGIPLSWRDEQSGVLEKAVWAYIEACCGAPEPTDKQLALLCAWCSYYIHAPCWMDNLKRGGAPNDMVEELRELMKRVKTLASFESIKRWSEEASELGLDPF